MNKFLYFAIASVAYVASAGPGSAQEIPILIVAGQSNAVGHATDIARVGVDAVPPQWLQPQPNVLYAGQQSSAVSWGAMTPPSQVSQIPAAAGGFGPELATGKTISDARGGQTYGVVKYAVSGTSLYQDWNSSGNPVPGEADLYYEMVARVNRALTLLPSQMGMTGKVAGFFWMQGESDIIEGRTTAQYEADLTALIAKVRSDFGAPHLPFVFGLMGDLPGYATVAQADGIRQAQMNVAANVNNTALIDPRSFTKVSDQVHYDNRGELNIGTAFGNAYLTLQTDPTPPAVLRVDLGPTSSPVAPGFAKVSSLGATVLGPYTVTIGGNLSSSFFDTVTSVGLTNSDPLLRDFIFNNNVATGGGIQLGISGLAPNTAYNFTGYSYQDTQATSLLIDPRLGTTGPQTTIANSGAILSSSSPEVKATGIYTTDGQGNLDLLITGLAGTPLGFGPRFNGFELSLVISAGDYNLDGRVDAGDYVVWRKTLGSNVLSGAGADGDGSGHVGSGDYVVWRTQFGAENGSSNGASVDTIASIPEPTTAFLLASMGVAMAYTVRSRRRICGPRGFEDLA